MGMKIMSKGERSAIRIMHVAKGLYEEKGIGNVTFNEIAEAADICRSTVFNHFPTSRDLILGIYNQEIDDIMDCCNGLGLEGEAFIETIFDKLIEDTCKYPAMTIEILSNVLASSEERIAVAKIEDIIMNHLPKKEESTEYKEERAIALIGAYYGLINHYHAKNLEFKPEDLSKRFSHLMRPILYAEIEE